MRLDGALIARSPSLGTEAFKTLWYLTAELGFADFSVIVIADVSRDLGLKSQAVSRALRDLIEAGILERGPRVGRRSSFRFSEAVAYRRWAA